MSNEVKLEVYLVKIRNLGETGIFLNMNELSEKESFLQFFQNYIKSFDHQLELNEEQKRSLRLDFNTLKVNADQGMISGIIESGDYGYESTIMSTVTKKQTYKRKKEDTEIKPFYFLLYLASNENKGYLVLQRLGQYGIHSVFTNHLREYFKAKYEGKTIEFYTYIEPQLAKKFIEDGGIKQFSMTRYKLPPDVTEKLGMVGNEEDVLSVELIIKARRGHFLKLNDKVKNFVKNKDARIFDIDELNNLGFDGDHKTKIQVKHGVETRTIDLSESGKIRPYYDIDGQVAKESGHPKFESIDKIAKELVKNIHTQAKG